jgi:hypothetical protein
VLPSAGPLASALRLSQDVRRSTLYCADTEEASVTTNKNIPSDANLNWEHTNEGSLLAAHGGWEFGSTLEAALPQLRAKKESEARATMSLLKLGPDDVLAEIGPGFGFEANFIAPSVKHIHLFEISQSFQDLARKNVKQPNVSMHLIQPSDLSALQGKDINKVYSGGVLIHFNVYDLAIYFEAISKILPRGGLFLFNYLNIESSRAFGSQEWAVTLESYRKDKIRLFGLMYWNSQETMRRLAHHSGFAVDQTVYPDQIYTYMLLRKV